MAVTQKSGQAQEIGNHFTFNVATEILGLSWIALGIIFLLVSSLL